MDAVRFVKVYQPSLACRIHNQSPQQYKKNVDVVKAGMGFPACHFDDSHIKMMLRKGFDFEDARDYCFRWAVLNHKIRSYPSMDINGLYPSGQLPLNLY